MTGSRRGLAAALVVAVTVLVSSVVLTLSLTRPWAWGGPGWWGNGPSPSGPAYGGGPMGGGYGPGMMHATGSCMPMGLWLAGDGAAVASIDAARRRADIAGRARGLAGGEVMAFSNHYYVILTNAQGDPATEVLVDPTSGAVCLEPGPATMWNTSWGVHPTSVEAGRATVTPKQARAAARAWLDTNIPGATPHQPDTLPGYYTLDYDVDGRVAGMLSVRATDASIWPHRWHGAFVSEAEPEP
ncbi:MAG: hypothetical protein WCF04_12035 [Candidatus Nanopelagicales bacterium]